MFLTLKNEKTFKKIRSKTLKNNIFFILGRNLIIRSFEIPHSIWKLHKDFKSVFVFKFRQKTKKFTPKWQKPLFEKRVHFCRKYQNIEVLDAVKLIVTAFILCVLLNFQEVFKDVLDVGQSDDQNDVQRYAVIASVISNPPSTGKYSDLEEYFRLGTFHKLRVRQRVKRIRCK